MEIAPRITMDPEVMGGKPCIRGLRVTVGTILGLLSGHRTREEILRAYPYLEPEDIDAALAYCRSGAAMDGRTEARLVRSRKSLEAALAEKHMTTSRPTCPVHAVPLLPGHAHIVYGYPAAHAPGGPAEAEEREFPNALTRVLGGCIVSPDNAPVDEVLYCPACREGLARWTAEWETRRAAERREGRRRMDGDATAES